VGRVQVEQYQRCSGGFAHSDSIIVNVHGKLRGGLRLARLCENEIVVGVRLRVEIDDQGRRRVSGSIQRIHVVHVVYAAHLLLERRGHGLFQGLRIGADIGGQNLNLRRRDIRKLSYRQGQDRQGADKHHDNGNHYGDDGSIDEEF